MNLEITERQRAYLTVALFIWREMLRREDVLKKLNKNLTNFINLLEM
jgi:hypothetical protein